MISYILYMISYNVNYMISYAIYNINILLHVWRKSLAGAQPQDHDNSSQDHDDSDRDYGPPDPHDDDDFGHHHNPSRARRAAPLDPLARFIQGLEDLSSMNGPDISSALNDLPMPQVGNVEGVSVQEAVAVCFISYII